MRMKWIATGLLVLAAVVYVISEKLDFYYLAAFSEAAMVGALADWFAVVALFRRPLNLPIPHTAIIPRTRSASPAVFGIHPANFFVGCARCSASPIPLPIRCANGAAAREHRYGLDLRRALRRLCP